MIHIHVYTKVIFCDIHIIYMNSEILAQRTGHEGTTTDLQESHGEEVSDMADQKEQSKENIDFLGKSPMGACAPSPMVSCSETCPCSHHILSIVSVLALRIVLDGQNSTQLIIMLVICLMIRCQ